MNAEAPAPPARERIVVGVDGSPASVDAVKWAAHQASLTGATLEAVIAWEYPGSYGDYPMGVDVNWDVNAQEILGEALQKAALPADLLTAHHAVEGHSAQVLIDAAVGADLLVVGSRGRGGFKGMLLGSVSEHVTAHASCPVVVVRHLKDD